MRIYISVDLEGIAGVTSWDEMEKDRPLVRKLMTGEVNAAIQGIRDAAVPIDEILVCDAHGGGLTLSPEDLDPAALLVRGSPRRRYMVAGLDGSYHLLFCIGYHASAGTTGGGMDHTYSGSSVHGITVNGEPVGELDFNVSVASHHGVPLALATGDDRLREQVARRAPWAEFVVAKYGIARFAAKHRHPSSVRAEIRAKAREAALRPERFRTLSWDLPLRVEFRLVHTSQADAVEPLGIERTDARTFRFEVPDWPTFYDRLSAITGLAARPQG
ncbi:MAG: M55 family metallopeptidase [Planctomycetes bacterium]|nr:M55 family metallopeptidase [Planctomycetota bacterium]